MNQTIKWLYLGVLNPSSTKQLLICVKINTNYPIIGEILPDRAGFPMGEEYGGVTYFMMETHYDNPFLKKGKLF